jgi:hypothetical protein
MKQFKSYKVIKTENENTFSLTIPLTGIIKNFTITRELYNKKMRLVFYFLVECQITNNIISKTLYYQIINGGYNEEAPDHLEYQWSKGNVIICLDTSKS